MSKPKAKSKSLLDRMINRFGYLQRQTSIYLEEQPDLKIYLPLAIPIVIFTQALIFIGRLITASYPHLLLKAYLAQFEPAYGKKLFPQLSKEYS
jgi:hypothetical protein